VDGEAGAFIRKAQAPVSGGANKAWLRALETTGALAGDGLILPEVIDRLAERYGDATALLSDHESLSYRTLAERSRAYARWALGHGLGKGDVVALMMPNRPDYLAFWLGVSRTGATVALINTNHLGPSLAHSIRIVRPAHVVAAEELLDRVQAVRHELGVAPRLWVRGEADGADTLDPAAWSTEPFAAGELPQLGLSDRALHSYTSGTTGLPKAANVSHHRLLMWAGWFAGMMDAGPQDRLYDCLPMYHSTGGVVAPGAMLLKGGSVVLAEKFSAGRFWDDIARWDCTVFQYIGELCRYLTSACAHPKERAHRLRLACGNGLREAVWRDFQDRFAVPQVLEFYAATEGTFSLYNAEGVPGAVGRVPPFLRHRFPAAVVRLDPATGQALRDADGRCLRCRANEPGEAIGKVAEGASRFEGYTDAGETEKKLLRDVFEPGDTWMRTGDLMRIDEAGFYRFVDRMGDTFRWKGENVSTAEVAEAVGAFDGVAEAVVYGVEVSGCDGKAGMAAVVARDGLDVAGLVRHLAERLPAYARPVFIRLSAGLASTETFKPTKQALVEQGFDPAATGDPILVLAGAGYIPLGEEGYRAILAGERRL
jgi:fatty-acyl-CoA synthase